MKSRSLSKLKKCRICEKEFLVAPCLWERRKYCSVECRRVGIKGQLRINRVVRVPFECKICHKVIMLLPRVAATRIVCSQSCLGGLHRGEKALRNLVACKTCRKEFRVKESVLRKGWGKYCSKACRLGTSNKLPEGRWAKKYACCRYCGKTDSKHHSLGECNRCYLRCMAKTTSGARYKQNALLKMFRSDEESFNKLVEKQGNSCAICGKHQDESIRKLHLDHNHKTGMIRGLLCAQCNVGLGSFSDDVDRMLKAIDYLKRTP